MVEVVSPFEVDCTTDGAGEMDLRGACKKARVDANSIKDSVLIAKGGSKLRNLQDPLASRSPARACFSAIASQRNSAMDSKHTVRSNAVSASTDRKTQKASWLDCA